MWARLPPRGIAGPAGGVSFAIRPPRSALAVRGEIGRSATTNPLDERIDQDQRTGSTLQRGRPQENIRNRLNPNPIRGRALTVRKVGALPDLDNITVRIADVAANLAVLGDRRGDELGSSTFP